MPRPSRSRLAPVAAATGALVIATGLSLSALSASADPLPVPLPGQSSSTSTSSSGTAVIDDTKDVVARITSPLTGSGSTSGGSSDGSGSSSTGSSSTGSSSGGSGSDAPLAPVGSGVKDALDTVDTGTKGTPLDPVVPGSKPGEVLKLSVNADPIARACAQVTGSGTAVANIAITVGGHDVGTPLVEALPGLLAPCPSGSTPPTNGGDAAVSDLVGTCIRINAAPPLEASVLLLDKELVAELTKAGVPLEKLVVPCPVGDGTGGDGGGDNGGDNGGGHDGGGDTGGTTGGGDTGSGNGGDTGTGAGHGGSGGGSGAGADGTCDPSLASQQTAGFVPGNAQQALPWLLLALALVGRRRLTRLVAHLRPERATAG